MIILLLIVLALAIIVSVSSPTYSTATPRRRRVIHRTAPTVNRSNNIILGVVGVILVLWLLGFIRVGNLSSPIERSYDSRPITRIP